MIDVEEGKKKSVSNQLKLNRAMKPIKAIYNNDFQSIVIS